MLSVIFLSLVKCCEDGDFVVLHGNGEKVLYKPFIRLIIGDLNGNNKFCCHHNCSSNNNEHLCLCNKCRCIFVDLSKVPHLYNFLTILDYRRLVIDVDFARSISQHPVRSAINELPLDKFVRGVGGITPPEKCISSTWIFTS